MRRRAVDGRSLEAEADALIKPNSRLSSFERLEIYSRQYWFRILSCFSEDFPGLRAIVGAAKFEKLARAYLTGCPSESFTLRNLGSRLEGWLESHLAWIEPHVALALDMVRLEWAHIEAFDGGSSPTLTPGDIESSGLDLPIHLQPYIRLLQLSYPVDDLLIEVHNYEGEADTSTNAAQQRRMCRRVRQYAELDPEGIYLAVHRLDGSVYYKRLQRESYRLLKELRSRRSLGDAIDTAFEGSSMAEEDRITATQTWFANWAELGWFCR